ncbi:hypothetical protein D2M30_0982 [Bacillus amyloliquefaciens]|uniref:hypothetical protein n=1 Tax=Bacillus amyloliquefaciens TaxID=1390 RepID=UPI000304B570|nr:hypothetical protein [Bacillus amyloliquefaciens]KYC92609.1 hypothetical protein B425_0941 [Bacillus amyloliquefaciens]QBG55313.1 hypothetical protein D2M30_0982 [Bacillus amyloliquefaciens]
MNLKKPHSAAAFLFYLPSRPNAQAHKVKNEMKIEGSGRELVCVTAWGNGRYSL